jgi:DNA-binding Lrp family transcriptional regulator
MLPEQWRRGEGVDEIDRAIINALQGGFPISERPFAAAAQPLGLTEAELLCRVQQLLEHGILSRFGPLYHAERLGGGLTLAAMQVPEDDVQRVAEIVNSFPEVAHNYARDHTLNMWFVVATEAPQGLEAVLAEIARQSGYPVYNLPKLDEFFLGLRFEA